jgi:PAS domain S-box-containing protein
MSTSISTPERRARFFDLSLDLMSISDFNGYFTELNDIWERTVGFTMAELTAEPYLSFVHPDDIEPTLGAFHGLLEGRRVVGFENRYRCKDGTYKWLQWHTTPDLGLKMVFAVARDVTERKRVDEELKRREHQYRSLVEAAQDLIWSIDRRGRWTFLNQAAARIYGYPAEDLIGRPVLDLTLEDNRARDLEGFTRAFEGESVFQHETTQTRRDGSLVHLSFNAVPLYDENGQIIGATGTASDISERRRAEERLLKQAEAIRSMATPIIQVWDRVVAMPIIGVMDTQRAAQVMETLLDEVARTRTRFAILDLTGVEVVDTSTANYLLKMVRAVSLLGGTCIVSGIAPAIASTMVGLGLDMAGLLTFGTLQAALRYAIRVSADEGG